jgi:hypothetical protein
MNLDKKLSQIIKSETRFLATIKKEVHIFICNIMPNVDRERKRSTVDANVGMPTNEESEHPECEITEKFV